MNLTLFYGDSLSDDGGGLFLPRQDKAVRVTSGGVEFSDLNGWPFDYVELENKHKRAMFSFWSYKKVDDIEDDEGLCFRDDRAYPKAIADNALTTQAIILDVDGGKDQNSARMSQMIERLVGYNFMLYTSYSHTDENHAYRIIIPLAEEVTKEEWRKRTDALKDRFHGCDTTCFDVSRTFYLPSHKPGSSYVFRYIDGREYFDFMSLPINEDKKIVGPVMVKRRVSNRDDVTQEDIDKVLERLKTKFVGHEPTWLKIAGAMAALGCNEYQFIEVTACVMNSKTPHDASLKWRYAVKKSGFFTRGSAFGTLVNIVKGVHGRN